MTSTENEKPSSIYSAMIHLQIDNDHVGMNRDEIGEEIVIALKKHFGESLVKANLIHRPFTVRVE